MDKETKERQYLKSLGWSYIKNKGWVKPGKPEGVPRTVAMFFERKPIQRSPVLKIIPVKPQKEDLSMWGPTNRWGYRPLKKQ